MSRPDSGKKSRLAMLLLFVLGTAMALGCGKKEATTRPDEPKGGKDSGAAGGLRENEVAAVFERWDLKNNKVVVKLDGVEKQYDAAEKVIFRDYGPAPCTINAVLDRDVILTLDKKDGKEVVTEARLPPPKKGPGAEGRRVEGKFVTVSSKKKPETLVLLIDGKEQEFPMADYVRMYDILGHQLQPANKGGYYATLTVIAILQKQGDAERVVEVWEKKS